MNSVEIETDKLSYAECRLLRECPNLRDPRVTPAKSHRADGSLKAAYREYYRCTRKLAGDD